MSNKAKPESKAPMLRFSHVSKRYANSRDALLDVSFDLAPGEMAFLTGRSGAGKSTLLKLIALIERSDRGQVMVANRNLSTLHRWQVPYHRRRIGLIFQDHQLLNDRKVFDNVALPLAIAGHGYREVGRRVRAALDQVDLLDKENARPNTLSGGEQQRVGIARAIVNKPRLLLADEPTGNLDPALSRDIMQLFMRLNQVGVSVLVATHDMDLVTALGQRVLTLSAGRLAQDLPAGAMT